MNKVIHPPQPTPCRHIKWFGRTDRGKVRPNNEDAFLGLRFDAREVQRLGKLGKAEIARADFAFAVSDGMGGGMAGEQASRIAVEKITTLLPRSFKLGASGLASGFSDVMLELYDQVHRTLTYLGDSDEECAGMETTLSVCWFTPEWMYFGHIGDSRIYYLPARERGLKQLSQDDTHVAWLFRTGRISEREARMHPRRNLLQKALGGNNQFIDPQVGAVGYEPGDLFLLCTDGLVEGLYDEQILEILRPAQRPKAGHNPADQLVTAALEKDGRDNTTAVVIQMI
jgi:protein phosphatase